MIVPGSPLGIDHLYSWYAVVEDKKTKKRWTYWVNGSQPTREEIAEHLRIHYPNVKPITIDRTLKGPQRVLQPVPPSHFQSFPVDDKGPKVDLVERILSPLKALPSLRKFLPPRPICHRPH